MKVLVISGGSSAERAVSLRSGSSVGRALETVGHEVIHYDPHDDESGSMLKHVSQQVDTAFPILHGKGGEDGIIQRQLESLNLPFVGSTASVSEQCFDKMLTLETVQTAGIIIPRTELISYGLLPGHQLTQEPFVLKPKAEGSSVDTFLVRKPEEFDSTQVKAAFERHNEMLIETLIEGTELTVAVLGIEPLPVIEIRPPENQDFDYENKYNGATQELCPPVSISQEAQQRAQVSAQKIHEIMGCRDFSRSDFMLDAEGQLFFLEINTLPGMTDQSLFPRAAAVAGLPMPQLVDWLVQAAYARHK